MKSVSKQLVPYSVLLQIFEVLENEYRYFTHFAHYRWISRAGRLTRRLQSDILKKCQSVLTTPDIGAVRERSPKKARVMTTILDILTKAGVTERYRTGAPKYSVTRTRDVTTFNKGSLARYLRSRCGTSVVVLKSINKFVRSKSKLTSLLPLDDDWLTAADIELPSIPEGSSSFQHLHEDCGVCNNYRGDKYRTYYPSYLQLAAAHSGEGTEKCYEDIVEQWPTFLLKKKLKRRLFKWKKHTSLGPADSQ
jgi:hypothetical protein